MICDIFPDDELGKNLGLIMSANGVGMLLGPLMGGLLYDKFGYAFSFYVVIGLSLIDALMRFMFLSDEVCNICLLCARIVHVSCICRCMCPSSAWHSFADSSVCILWHVSRFFECYSCSSIR